MADNSSSKIYSRAIVSSFVGPASPVYLDSH